MKQDEERGLDSGNFLSRARIIDLIVIAVFVFSAGFIGSRSTIPNIPTWYEGLEKPFFNPPNWVFGPVWTLLYLTMIWAGWRVIGKVRGTSLFLPVIAVFGVQLFFNALWPVVFFGMHQPGFAVPVVLALDLSVYALVGLFYKIDRNAGLSQLPYAAWVSFASLLNIAVFALNLPQ